MAPPALTFPIQNLSYRMYSASAVHFPMIERAKLATYAVAAELIFALAGLLAIMPFLVLQVGLFGHRIPRLWTVILAVALVAGMWWWSRPHINIAGRRISRHEAPDFFSALDTLSVELDAPRINEIVLSDELNAGAHEAAGLPGLTGGKRTLILGVPLLHLLTRAEMLAVVAHELGHFSRKHGRLGHWVYNVRSKWTAYLYTLERDDSGIDRLRRWIARAFLPHFIRRAGEWSRACEYEADHFAASASSGVALAQALTKMATLDGLFATKVRHELRALQMESAEAPDNYLGLVRQCAAQSTEFERFEARAVVLARPPRPGDSHPPLEDRLRALGEQTPCLAWNDAESAGEAFLGAAWKSALVEVEQRWRTANETSWRFWHLYMHALERPEAFSALTAEEAVLRRFVFADIRCPTQATLCALQNHAG